MRILTTTAMAAMLSLGALTAIPTSSQAQWGYEQGVSVDFPPPPLPVYDQPPMPDDGYLWTPGYWAWDPGYGDYYWVPGTWVLPPDEGLLWTPAWWGWEDGAYLFHPGYWGPHIGYYGGVDYGFGYTGYGYQGGYWRGREFFYNRSVNNLRNGRTGRVFDRPVMRASRPNRVSYSGGMGGVIARPTPEQITAMRERHVAPTPDQTRHVQMAGSDRSLSAKVNHGAPPITATPRPGAFAPQRQAPPQADRPQGGPPPRPGLNPGYRPGPQPRTYPPARPNDHGGGGEPPRQPAYPAPRTPGYHPPSGNPGFAPPPRQAPPQAVMRVPPQQPPPQPQQQRPQPPPQRLQPPPPHTEEKKNQPPH
jgi:hypothetical protein